METHTRTHTDTHAKASTIFCATREAAGRTDRTPWAPVPAAPPPCADARLNTRGKTNEAVPALGASAEQAAAGPDPPQWTQRRGRGPGRRASRRASQPGARRAHSTTSLGTGKRRTLLAHAKCLGSPVVPHGPRRTRRGRVPPRARSLPAPPVPRPRRSRLFTSCSCLVVCTCIVRTRHRAVLDTFSQSTCVPCCPPTPLFFWAQHLMGARPQPPPSEGPASPLTARPPTGLPRRAGVWLTAAASVHGGQAS